MLQEFLDGNLWLLIDKDRKEEISDLWNIVRDHVRTWPYQKIGYSLYEYLSYKKSGPYHYMNGNRLIGQVFREDKQVISLTDFLNSLSELDIQEDEMMEMLK